MYFQLIYVITKINKEPKSSLMRTMKRQKLLGMSTKSIRDIMVDGNSSYLSTFPIYYSLLARLSVTF